MPWRNQQVIDKVRARAIERGVPPDLCEALWRQMIGWFIQYEEEKLRSEIEDQHPRASPEPGDSMILVITPTLQADVNLWLLSAAALLNPAVVAVGYLMGRKADQLAKLIVAAFAASVCGLALVWFATLVRVPAMATLSRAAAGLFALQCISGLAYAWFGYRMARAGRPKIMSVLRAWFIASALVVTGLFIYAFVPVLIPIIAITVILGGITTLIVMSARWLERCLAQRKR